jgi:predicted transcriptional regulator
MSESLTLALPPALADRVRAAAAESGESVETVVGRALEAWLEDNAEDARALQQLERRWAAVQAGEATVSHDAVARWLDTWGEAGFKPWRS